jgi:hypothetical protein
MSRKHFLITRFNANLTQEPISFDRMGDDKRYNPEWIEHRVRLFEQVCAPTVLNQTNQDFEWIVLFGEHTSPTFLHHFNRGRFHPVVGSHWDLFQRLDRTIRSLGEETDFVMTTNLDSDDGISKDFMDVVQYHAMDRDMVINIPYGIKWDLATDTYVSTQSSHSPFSTVIEQVTSNPLRTINSYSHGMLHGFHEKMCQVEETQARWLQGIHGDNLSNRLRLKSEDKLKPFADMRHLFYD